jgi:hypothetical protein
MNKQKWLEWWIQAIIDSGYYFMLDTNYIKKQITAQEIDDLSPEESAAIYIEVAKEAYDADKSGG